MEGISGSWFVVVGSEITSDPSSDRSSSRSSADTCVPTSDEAYSRYGEDVDELVEGVLGVLAVGGPGNNGKSSLDFFLGFQGRFFTGVLGASGNSTIKSL